MAKQTFTTGQVLTAAQMTSLQQTAMLGGAANAKVASYVLVAADAGDAITMSNASPTTITVNTGLFAAGDIVTIINLGAGACTITAGTATVDTSGSLVLATNQGGVLRFTSASAAIFFQFATPASGDIEGVTAGTGISGGGTSGTVTITNSMATAIDAKGDLVVGTGADTFSRLAVGTNGHTLVANSATSTGLEWQAASSGAMALVRRSSFTDVANTGTTFDDVFTSTYKSYRIVIENIFAVTEANDLYFQFRYAGPTTEAGNTYYGNQLAMISTSTTTTNNASNGVPQFILSTRIGQTNFRSSGIFDVTRVGDGNRIPNLSGTFVNGSNNETFITLGLNIEQRTFTGFILRSSSTNIDGTVAVYGLV